MAEIENIRKSFNDWKNANNELYNVSVDYIKDRLSSLPNNEIYLNFEVTISYIGFYNINPYSKIKCVYLKNGDIYADTEDEDDYKITNANADELYEIAKAISSITEK